MNEEEEKREKAGAIGDKYKAKIELSYKNHLWNSDVC